MKSRLDSSIRGGTPMAKDKKTAMKKKDKGVVKAMQNEGMPTQIDGFSAEERKKIEELFPD